MKKKILIIICSLLAVVLAVSLFFVFKDDEAETILYTVNFITNSDSVIKSEKVEKGSKVTKPSNPTKEGYEFAEWQLDGIPYDFNLIVTKDLTLTAKWKEIVEDVKTYVIKFNTDGGDEIENQTVEENDLVVKPTDPTKKGYKFKYWSLDNKEYDFKSIVTEDLELKAIWEKDTTNTKTYKVSFNTDGGSSISSKTVNEGSKITKPSNPTKDGYEFVEWQLDGKVYNFNTVVTKDITLKAVWKKISTPIPNKYTVSFNTDGGSSVDSSIINEGNKVTKPSNPTKSGYEFVEWQLDGVTYNFNDVVTKDITLKAVWKKVEVVKNYTVTVTKVDDISPARVLVIKENGKEISVKEVKYSDGALLCKGNSLNVNKYAIDGETSLILVLNDGSSVVAKVN